MTQAWLLFGLSAAVIIGAGVMLARTADRISELTGFGRLLVGVVLLAAATSLPELGVDVSAALHGLDDVAVGDLTGSCLMNLIVLAVADLMHRSKQGMLSHAAAAHAISGVMSILLAGLAALMISIRPGWQLWTVGIGSTVVFVAYALGIRVVYYDRRQAEARLPDLREGARIGRSARRSELRRVAIRFGLAAIAVLAASPFMAHSAGRIAAATGWGETFVGTTLVAFTTSLPELTATLVAVRMGAFDLAVGNVFGSNAFDMAMLFFVDVASPGPLLSSISATHAVTCLWIVVITSVVVVGQLYQVERRRRLIEPDALLVLALVAAALFTVYRLG